MWCMVQGVKVHLGYWIAHACHMVRTHPDLHLFTCNLLGAFLKRNIVTRIADTVTDLPMCDTSGSFDLPFFFNKGLASLKDGEVKFYGDGGQEVVTVQHDQEEEASTSKESEDDWKKMDEAMLIKLDEAANSQRRISEDQTRKMTQAIEVMLKMIDVVERRIPSAQPPIATPVQHVPVQPVGPLKQSRRKDAATPPPPRGAPQKPGPRRGQGQN